MGFNKNKTASKKHGNNQKIVPEIKDEITRLGYDKKLSCAAAFQIAEKLGVNTEEVGQTADIMGAKLIKCRLGLFGHGPENKTVKPEIDESGEIRKAITKYLINEKLPCKEAFNIAERMNIRKIAVSNVCDGIGVKIKPCQLGAF